MKFRRIIAILLALVMVFALAACGGGDTAKDNNSGSDNSNNDGGSSSGGSYYIGINTWGSGVPVLDMFGDAKEYTLKTLGHTVNRMSDDFSADKELQNAQNMIAAQVDGIVYEGSGITTVPQMAELCANAGIPFALDVFIGDDADLAKLAETNEFYCGAIDSDMVADGAAIAEIAYANGCRNACMIGGNMGDNNMDARSKGFSDKFKELGGTILYEARCTDNSECQAKASDMLAANPQTDCVYAFAGDYIPGSLAAAENLGMDEIQFYVSCVDEGTAQYIKEGKVVAGNDGISLASYISCTLVLNYLAGHKIVDENGKAPRLSTHPFPVNQDNVDDYCKVFFTDGYSPFTKEMLEALLYTSNPDVSYQDYVDLIANINLDYMLESNGLK